MKNFSQLLSIKQMEKDNPQGAEYYKLVEIIRYSSPFSVVNLKKSKLKHWDP